MMFRLSQATSTEDRPRQDFRDRGYEQSSPSRSRSQMAQNVKSNRIISKLAVADAGVFVVTNTRSTSTVLLFLNQSVTSAASQRSSIDPSRVQFTMVRGRREDQLDPDLHRRLAAQDRRAGLGDPTHRENRGPLPRPPRPASRREWA